MIELPGADPACKHKTLGGFRNAEHKGTDVSLYQKNPSTYTSVERITRGAEALGVKLSHSEIAKLSGVSRSYISKRKNYIEELRADVNDSLSRKQFSYDTQYFSDKVLSLFVAEAESPADLMSYVCGYVLRFKSELTEHAKTLRETKSIGRDVFEVIRVIDSRKNKSRGKSSEVNIYARSGAGRRLLYHNTKVGFLDELFDRRESYDGSNKIILWRLTSDAKRVLKQTMKIVMKHLVLFRFCDIRVMQVATTHGDLVHIRSPSVVYESPPTLKGGFTEFRPQLVFASFDTLERFELASVMHILNVTVAVKSGGVLFSAHHASNTIQSHGRNYNVFTRIHAEEREMLGYTAYDISSALQSICLNFIKDTKGYPLLRRYAKIKKFKRNFREQIARETGKSTASVKADLTAYANGKVPKKTAHELEKRFYEESDRMRREFLATIYISYPEVIRLAVKQSRKKIPDNIDWLQVATDDIETSRNKSSVFFFVWTWFERKIRHAMMEILTDGIEVHDAVYSRKTVSVKKLIRRIHEKTGIALKIDRG